MSVKPAISDNDHVKTPSGWWVRCPDHFTKGQKIHNEIELELRKDGIKPLEYANRGPGYGEFRFRGKRRVDKGTITVFEPDYLTKGDSPDSPVTVMFVRDGHPDVEYYSNKNYIFSLLK